MLSFDPEATASISNSFNEVIDQLRESQRFAVRGPINGSFSAVSGLDQLGRGHGLILDGGSGSAASVLESLGELVSWCQQTLNLHTAALTTQDMAHRVGLITQNPNESDVFTAPGRPSGRFDGLDPINAVVAAAVSVDQLAEFFTATRLDQVEQAQRAWLSMGQHVGRVADELRLAGDNLVGANQGAAFEKGQEQLTRLAAVADEFSHNAHVMAEATGRLFGVHAYGSNIVHAAQTGLAALPPAERVAAEQAFLHAFPAEFQPAVTAAIPQISHLTTPIEAHQATNITTGIDEHTQAFTHHLTTPAGWNASAGLGTAAGPATGSSHHAASQHAGQPSGHPGHTPTTPAAHLPPGTPPPPAAAPTHGGRTQPAGLWAPSKHLTTAPQPTRGPVPAAGRGGPGHVLDTTRTIGGPLGSTPSRSLLSSGQIASGTGQVRPPAIPAIGAPPRAGHSPISGHHLGGGHTPHTGGVGGHPPAGSTAHPAGGPPAHQKTTGAARPVAAMPPMTPAAQQNGRHKPVKTVTTAVEADANTQAIFGNRRPVLPGVIGEWTKH